MNETVYLYLEDGTLLTGKQFGAPLKEDITAELVFTTGMTGYVATLTDPSYYGQMVIQTFPLIGNYGVNPQDFESDGIHMRAYLVKEWCRHPSNFRSKMDLDTFLKQQNIPGVYGLDTRTLTKRIREKGTMNAILSAEPISEEKQENLTRWHIVNAVEAVTCKASYEVSPMHSRFHVVLWDFGFKRNILRKLQALGCRVTVVPAGTTCEEIAALSPDGILLSNGPGDPKDNPSVIAELAKLCKIKIPIFGICLGHQLLALANHADTGKLKYGHRGANQPVKNVLTKRSYITSQNHGYAVAADSLPDNAEMLYTNINDNTCEGIRYNNFPAFSVQFHPEACGGPHDTEFLFEDFMELMEKSALHSV